MSVEYPRGGPKHPGTCWGRSILKKAMKDEFSWCHGGQGKHGDKKLEVRERSRELLRKPITYQKKKGGRRPPRRNGSGPAKGLY